MPDSGMHQLIERQLRNWELASSQSHAEPRRDSPTIQPYVAISRTLGSHGRELADRLSEVLGWTVYDKEILDFMAHDDAVHRRLYALVDERVTGFLDSIAAALRPEAPQTRDDYVHKLIRAVRAVALQSHAIYVGRGAGHILPPDRGLHVRVVAPLEQSVTAFAQRRNISVEEAEVIVSRTNNERDRFVKRVFRVDAKSTDCYDFILNTGRVTLSEAVQSIVPILHARGWT